MINDWNFNGVEHLERAGCTINIRENLNKSGIKITSIEISPDIGWKIDGSRNNRVIKKVVGNDTESITVYWRERPTDDLSQIDVPTMQDAENVKAELEKVGFTDVSITDPEQIQPREKKEVKE